MNNFQVIVENDTRAAMHMAVELCEQGDFDSVTAAFRWLMEDCGNAELRSGEREWREVVVGGRTEGYECECGHMMPEVPRFCPNCGWKAVKR